MITTAIIKINNKNKIVLNSHKLKQYSFKQQFGTLWSNKSNKIIMISIMRIIIIIMFTVTVKIIIITVINNKNIIIWWPVIAIIETKTTTTKNIKQ